MNRLDEWLAKIEELHPHSIDMGLERVSRVALDLGLTQFEHPVITVTGTNGKGSCVKFLESIFLSDNYRVGTYTSPHLLRFNERICINGQQISDQTLCESFEIIDRARKDIPLTFFEFSTLAALWIFKQSALDVLILEVGMGGRLDAVNWVDADIAIVSSIALDHMEWLGSNREEIGYEKAGIFRSDKIAICGDPSPPQSLQQHAKELGTKLYSSGNDFTYSVSENHWSWKSSELELDHLPLPSLSIINAATSLMAISKLKGPLKISKTAIRQGLEIASLQGRFQIIHEPYACILDVAHNPAATKMLAERLECLSDEGRFIAVVGMLADKDILNTLRPLTPMIKEWHLGSLNIKRGASSDLLASHVKDFEGLSCYTYNCVSKAFKVAANCLNPGDRIVVFGSFYTVAEVLCLLQKEERQ